MLIILNNQFLTSIHTADLTYNDLPSIAKESHLFRKLASGSILSIGQLCDANYQVYFNKSRMFILFEQKIVLTGTSKTGGCGI